MDQAAGGETRYGFEPEVEAPAEPVILPGESLAKYKPGGDAAAVGTVSAAAPAPVVDTFVAAGWDGGLVLPGETIRPRAGQAGLGQAQSGQAALRNDAQRDARGSRESGRGDRHDRNDRDRNRGGRGERNDRGSQREFERPAKAPLMTPLVEAEQERQVAGALAEEQSGRPDVASASVQREQGNPFDQAEQTAQPGSSAIHAIHSTFVPPPPMPSQVPSGPSLEPGSAAAHATGQDAMGHDATSQQTTGEHTTDQHATGQDVTGQHETAQPGHAPVEVVESIGSHAGHEDLAAMQDYEPSEASAFYRVDPVPPSEYRQAAPAVEELPELQPEGNASDGNLTEQPILSEELLGAEESKAARFEGEASETDEQVQPEPLQIESVLPEGGWNSSVSSSSYGSNRGSHQHEIADGFAEPASDFVQAVEMPVDGVAATPVEMHELTSLSDTGNMHSDPAPASEHQLPSYDEAGPASPIAHEGAVVEAGAPHLPVQPYFEPGTGHLEEEMLDDDEDSDGPLPTLHAHTAADFNQQEHESLENAADLGVMIRELSIDQITRTEPALDEDEDEDEDEDFEEDFLEEDMHEEDIHEEDQEFSSEGGGEGEESVDDHAYAGNDSEHAAHDLGEPSGTFADGQAPASDETREPRREGRGNDRGRRDGRGRDRNRRPGGGFSNAGADRDRSSTPERAPSHSGGDRGRRDGGRGRQTMQSTNLPAISDLLKPGQEILVQIAKEPIAKKGARITSHIALPGRFLVFMPTVSHTGVSRKIESDGERRRLKEILLSEKGDAQGGFIVRTAAAGASEEELRSDLRFLLNLWSDIKTRSESSKSPALIYHDLNLIERVLRDQVTDTFSAIWVDSETEYERVLRFLQRFQPSLIRRVKLYTKETPLFEQFGITEEINKALRSKVWLKSGGSIVINQTEALVAIDINTGKFVGKTARLEDTIVKTNLDAIPEIVRQIRLRDLGGIIIIDFIDMDERKNRNKVMAALEEELKSDRAPSKVLQFNDFGLVAITRKRVKQSLERTLSTTCGVCAGTGMVKSPVTVCNDIYVEMRKMAKHLDRGDVMLRVNPEVVKQLKAPNTHWLQEMEEMVGKTILIKSDPSLHPEQFDIH